MITRSLKLIVLFLLLTSVYTAEITWISSVTADFNDDSAWSGGVAPSATDSAVFDGSGTGDCNLTESVSLVNLKLNSGYTGNVDTNGFSLNLSGDLSLNDGELKLSTSTHSIAGNVFIDGSSKRINAGSSTLHLTGSGTFENGHWQNQLSTLQIADAGQTTEFIKGGRTSFLIVGSGSVTASASTEVVVGLGVSGQKIITINQGASFNNSKGHYVNLKARGSGGYNTVDGADLGSGQFAVQQSATGAITILGDITCGLVRIDEGKLNCNNHNITANSHMWITGSIDLTNSTVVVGGDFKVTDDGSTKQIYKGMSTVHLTGTGLYKNNFWNNQLYKLKIADAGETTEIQGSGRVSILEVGAGVVSASSTSELTVGLGISNSKIISVNTLAKFNDSKGYFLGLKARGDGGINTVDALNLGDGSFAVQQSSAGTISILGDIDCGLIRIDEGKLDCNNYNIAATSDMWITGSVDLTSSTIKVGGNFKVTDDGATGQITKGTSTVHLTGSGYYKNNFWKNQLYRLIIAESGQTTEIQGGGRISKLEIGSGIVSASQASELVMGLGISGEKILTVNPAANFNDSKGHYLDLSVRGSSSGTNTIDGFDIGGGNLRVQYGSGTISLLGDADCDLLRIDDGTLDTSTHDISTLDDMWISGQLNINSSSIITVGGDFKITSANGDVQANSSVMHIAGDWLNTGGGTMNMGTSNVIFESTSADQDITVAGEAFNLVTINTAETVSFNDAQDIKTLAAVTDTANIDLQFKESVIHNIDELNLSGSNGNYVLLDSSDQSNEWGLTVSGQQFVNGVNVARSDASTSAYPIRALGSIDSGSNTNWIFSEQAIWDGGAADNNWSSAENWLSDNVPGINSEVIFDNTSDKNVVIDQAVSVASVSINDGYDGIIDQQANVTLSSDLIIESGRWEANDQSITSAGSVTIASERRRFIAGTSTVTLTGTGTVANRHGTNRFYNLNVAATGHTTTVTDRTRAHRLYIGAGTFDCNALPIYVGSPASTTNEKIFTVDAAANIINISGFRFYGGTGNTYEIDGGALNQLATKKSGCMTFYNNATYKIQTRDLNTGCIGLLSDCTLDLNGYNVTTTHDIHVGRRAFSPTLLCGTSTITCRDFELISNGGAPTADLGSATINVNRHWRTDSGAVITAGTSNIVFNGNKKQNADFGNSAHLATITVNKTGNKMFFKTNGFTAGTLHVHECQTVRFQNGQTFAVNDNFTLAGSASCGVKVESMTPGSAWLLDVDANATQSLSYVCAQDSDASSGAQINATNNGCDDGGNTNWNFVTTQPLMAMLSLSNPPTAMETLEEDEDVFTFDVTLTGTVSGTVVLNVETSTGAAAVNSDFTLSSSSLSFTTAGTQQFTLSIDDDAVIEGPESLIVTLSSTSAVSIVDVVQMTIVEDDEPPVPSLTIEDTSVDEGDLARVTVSLDEPANQEITVTYTTGDDSPASAVADTDYTSQTGIVTIAIGADSADIFIQTTADNDVESDETFKVTLSSPVNALIADADAIVTIVNDDVVNLPPIVMDDEYFVPEGGTLNIAAPGVLGNDNDPLPQNVALTATLVSADTNGDLTFDPSGDGSFDFTHDGSESPAEFTFVYSVTDNVNPAVEGEVTITINPVNDPPVITSTAGDEVNEGELYTYPVTVDDPDNTLAELSFHLNNEPTGMEIDENGVITWTPGEGVTTSGTVTVIVSDGGTTDGTQNFVVDVLPVNNPPVISGLPATTIEINTFYSFTPLASDADGDDLQFTILGLPSWASFNSNTGNVSGLPVEGDEGNYPGIVISVTDNIAPPVPLATFSIDVYLPNTAPVVDAGIDQQVLLSASPITLNGTATDDGLPLNSSLTYTWSTISGPDVVSFFDESQLNTTATFTSTGTYVLQLSVTDGELVSVDTLTVIVADQSIVTLGAPSASTVNEINGSTVTIPVTISHALASDLSVTLAVSGSASSGDYTLSPSPVVITQGTTSANATITITGDTILEIDETIIVSIASSGAATIGIPSSQTVTIIDDEAPPVVQFTNTSMTVVESSNVVLIPFESDVPLAEIVNVTYSLSLPGTGIADASDVSFDTETMVLNSGENANYLRVYVLDENILEGAEALTITIDAAPANEWTVGTNNSFIVNIQDPTTVSFGADTYSVAENVSSIDIPINLNYAAVGDFEVQWQVTGGNVIASEDHALLYSGTVNFSVNDTTNNLHIEILNDSIVEPPETLEISLIAVDNVADGKINLGTYPVTTLTITDDDTGVIPEISWDTLQSPITEADQTLSLNVNISQAPATGVQVVVPYILQAGTATGGLGNTSDYVQYAGEIIFTDTGPTTQSIAVVINDDEEVEGEESFTVQLLSASNATLNASDVHTVTVTDDDLGAVVFAVDGVTGNVSGGTYQNSAQLSIALEPANASAVIYYQIDGGALQTYSGAFTLNDSASITAYAELNTIQTPSSAITITVVDDNDYPNDSSQTPSTAVTTKVSPYSWEVAGVFNDTAVRGAVDGNVIPGAVTLGNKLAFMNAPLVPETNTLLTLTPIDARGTAGQPLQKLVHWEHTKIEGNATIYIRAGDSLLLAAPSTATGNVSLLGLPNLANGESVILEKGCHLKTTFSKPGVCTISVEGSSDDLTVIIAGNPFSGQRLISEVDYTRDVSFDDDQLVYTSADTEVLLVTQGGAGGPGAMDVPVYDCQNQIYAATDVNYQIKVLDRGTPYIVARINQTNNSEQPIIAYKEVEEFTLWNSLNTRGILESEHAILEMQPYIDGVILKRSDVVVDSTADPSVTLYSKSNATLKTDPIRKEFYNQWQVVMPITSESESYSCKFIAYETVGETETPVSRTESDAITNAAIAKITYSPDPEAYVNEYDQPGEGVELSIAEDFTIGVSIAYESVSGDMNLLLESLVINITEPSTGVISLRSGEGVSNGLFKSSSFTHAVHPEGTYIGVEPQPTTLLIDLCTVALQSSYGLTASEKYEDRINGDILPDTAQFSYKTYVDSFRIGNKTVDKTFLNDYIVDQNGDAVIQPYWDGTGYFYKIDSISKETVTVNNTLAKIPWEATLAQYYMYEDFDARAYPDYYEGMGYNYPPLSLFEETTAEDPSDFIPSLAPVAGGLIHSVTDYGTHGDYYLTPGVYSVVDGDTYDPLFMNVFNEASMDLAQWVFDNGGIANASWSPEYQDWLIFIEGTLTIDGTIYSMQRHDLASPMHVDDFNNDPSLLDQWFDVPKGTSVVDEEEVKVTFSRDFSQWPVDVHIEDAIREEFEGSPFIKEIEKEIVWKYDVDSFDETVHITSRKNLLNAATNLTHTDPDHFDSITYAYTLTSESNTPATYYEPTITVTPRLINQNYKNTIMNVKVDYDTDKLEDQHYRFTKIEHATGLPLSANASIEVIPSVGQVELSEQNLNLTFTLDTWNTPLMGPDLSISYNSQDYIDRGWGYGWTTNYDMLVVDETTVIDETGGIVKFDISSGKSVNREIGSILEERTEDPEAVDNSPAAKWPEDEETGYLAGERYRLDRLNHITYFFNGDGWLVRLKTWRQEEIHVTRDAQTNKITLVSDAYGRSVNPEDYFTVSDGKLHSFKNICKSGIYSFEYDEYKNITSMEQRALPQQGIIPGEDFALEDTSTLKYTFKYENTFTNFNGETLSTGQVTKIVYPDKIAQKNPGGSETVIDSSAAPDYIVNLAFGGAVTYTLNQDNFVTSTTRQMSNTSAEDLTSTYTYVGNGFPLRTSVSISGTLRSEKEYDERGNVIYDITYAGPDGDNREILYEYHPTLNMPLKTTILNVRGVGSHMPVNLVTTNEYYEGEFNIGSLRKMISPTQATSTFTYTNEVDKPGFLATSTDELNNTWSVIERTAYGNVKKVETAGNRVLLTTFENSGEKGLVKTTTDLRGLQTSYEYDARQRPWKVTDTTGAFKIFVRTPNNRIAHVITSPLVDKDSNQIVSALVSSNTYDTWHRLRSSSQPGVTKIDYDYERNGSHWLVEQTQGSRNLGKKEVDAAGRIIARTVKVLLNETDESATDCVTTFSYNANTGYLGQITNALSEVTTYYRNLLNQEIRIESPAGNIDTVYNTGSNLLVSTDNNCLGWQLSTTNPLAQKVSMVYDRNGRVIENIGINGVSSRSLYNSRGEIISFVPACGLGSTWTYGPDGIDVTLTVPDGNKVARSLNANGDAVTAWIKPGGSQAVATKTKSLLPYSDAMKVRDVYLYNGDSVTSERNFSSITGSLLDSTSVEDAGNDGLNKVTFAGSRGVTLGGDGLALGTFTTMQLGIGTNNQTLVASVIDRDAINGRITGGTSQLNLTSENVMHPVTGEIQYSKDDRNGDLKTTDRIIERDKLGRPIKWLRILGDNKSITFEQVYDEAGRVVLIDDPIHGASYKTYTPLGQVKTLISKGERNGSVAVGGIVNRTDYNGINLPESTYVNERLLEHRDYSVTGELLSLTVNGRETTYNYDSKLRFIDRVEAPGDRIQTTAYDPIAKTVTKTQNVAAGIRTIIETHDDLERVINRTISVNASSSKTETFEYYPRGRIKKHTRIDGKTHNYTYYPNDDSLFQNVIKDIDDTTILATITYEKELVSGGGYKQKITETIPGTPDDIVKARILTFDRAGRLVSTEVTGQNTVAMEYNLDNTVKSRGVFEYSYNNLGQLNGIKDGRHVNAEITEVSYYDASSGAAAGMKEDVIFKNGIMRHYTYTDRGLLATILQTYPASGAYTGNITGSELFACKYDEQDRLIGSITLKCNPGTNFDTLYDNIESYFSNPSYSLANVVEEERVNYLYDSADHLVHENIIRADGEDYLNQFVFDPFGNKTKQLSGVIIEGFDSAPTLSPGSISFDATTDKVRYLSLTFTPNDLALGVGETSGSAGVGFDVTTIGATPTTYKINALTRVDNNVYTLHLNIDDGTEPIEIGPLANNHPSVLELVIQPDDTMQIVLSSSGEELRQELLLDGPIEKDVTLFRDDALTTLDSLRWQATTSGYVVTDFTYNLFNQLSSSSNGTASTVYTYTDGGHLYETKIDGVLQKSYLYDYADRLLQVKDGIGDNIESIEYTDSSWQRKTVTHGTNVNNMTTFMWDGDHLLSASKNNATIEYAYYQGAPLWEINDFTSNGKSVGVYTKNHRADVTGIYGHFGDSTADKGMIRKYRYDAFGRIIDAEKVTYQPLVPSASLGELSLANLNPGPRYRGYWHEGGSVALYHTQNRHYDPLIGRFLQLDPARDGVNWYTYAGGDPVNRWDPSGLFWRFYGDPAHGKYTDKTKKIKKISASWIEDGTIEPNNKKGPNQAQWDLARAEFPDAPIIQPWGTTQDGFEYPKAPPHFDLLPIHLIGPGIRKNPILDGLTGARFELAANFAMKYENGRYLVSTTKSENGGWNFTDAPEAGLEHYIYLRIESASRHYDLGADMVAQMYSIGGVGDVATIAGLSQWLVETEAGRKAAKLYGLTGVAVGGTGYLIAKKFKLPNAVKEKISPLLNIARQKVMKLAKQMEDIGLKGSNYKYRPRPKNIRGAAQAPKRPFAPNADGVVRSTDEAEEILRNSIKDTELDMEGVQFNFLDPEDVDLIQADDAAAEYFSGNDLDLDEIVTWESFLNDDGNFPVKVDPSILNSDEAIIGNLAHELYEINHLKVYFEESGGSMTLRRLRSLINPGIKDNLHDKSWDFVNNMLWPE